MYLLNNQQITCNITVVSNSENFNIKTDFADDDIRQNTINDNTINLFKSYALPQLYNISVRILNNNLTNFFVVYSKDR